MRQTSLPPTHRRGGVMLFLMLLLIAGCVGGAYWYFYIRSAESDGVKDLLTDVVARGRFDHIVLEQGEIESSKNLEIECEVENRGGGGTIILWVIDEGTPVKKGDKLVELDASQLQQELNTQKIVVLNADAAVTNAEALVKQAEISREEYLEGTFKTEEKAIESEIAVAEQELRKAQLALGSTQRLVAKGLVKSLQMEADQFAVANAKNQLDAAEGRLKVLRKLTKQKFLVQFDSDIEAAHAVLEAAKSTMAEDRAKLEDIGRQIEACVIYAPDDGVVVHANKFSGRGGAEFVVEAGAMVRQRQAIIRLPDPTKMQVKAKINESRVALVDSGMPCLINVSSMAGTELRGQVTKVNRYAEPSSFFSSSIKQYACYVKIIDPPENIRTGMTAEVQIFVEQKENAIQVPVQAIYEHADQTYALVQRSDGSFDTREVTVDAVNEKHAAIASGLIEGEVVVLNLRQHLDLLTGLPEKSDALERGLMSVAPAADESSASADDSSQQPPAERSGGGPPSPASIVKRIFDESDTNKDGNLSREEIANIEGRRKQMVAASDSDSDGSVTRAELTNAINARFNSRAP